MTIFGLNSNGSDVRNALLTFGAVIAIALASTQAAKADFVGVYALSNFTLTNEDGDVLQPSAPAPTGPSSTNGCLSSDGLTCLSPSDPLYTDATSITILGGNSFSGEPGSTILSIDAAATGTVSFSWSYSTQDLPAEDAGGYEVNGVPTLLSDGTGIDNVTVTAITGTVSFNVTQGEEFGFDLSTMDNFGGYGYLTISDFSAPLAATDAPVPEPRMPLMILGLAVSALLIKRRIARASQA